jgi:anti-anti-sigma factor
LDFKDAPRVVLEGELDLYRRDEIAAALPPAESVDRVILDMRGVTVMDSSIIALLMRYRRAFVEHGKNPHDIVIVVPPPLRRIFEITGLLKLLTIVSAPITDTAEQPLQET